MSDHDVMVRDGAAAAGAPAAPPNGREGAGAGGGGGTGARRSGMDPLFGVRTADIEPYIGLRYLSKLFRFIALILLLLLVAEVVTGLVRVGTEAIPTLVPEVSRLIVLAGLLWGVGDLAILLIDVGHDVRATRILVGRQTAHLTHHPHDPPRAAADAAPAPPAEVIPGA